MNFLFNHLDYIFFFYGLSFVILAVISYLLYRKKNTVVPWEMLALFGIFHGVNEWIEMISLPLGEVPGFNYIKVAVLLVSFVFLFEFGRSGLKAFYPSFFGGMSIIWQYALLISIIFILNAGGLKNYGICVRYVFGLTGGLLSAFLLFKVFLKEKNARYYFLVASVSFGAYAIAAGIIVPSDPFYPASCLNYATFAQYALFPVQVLRAAIVVVLSIIFWEYYCFSKKVLHNELIEIKFGYGKWLTVAIIAVLVCGWLLTSSISQNFDTYQREDFKTNVSAIATGIDLQKLKRLKDAPVDMETQEYKAIRLHMQAFEGAMKKGIRWLYMMKMKNGKIIFTIDSSPETESDFTPPGVEWKPGENDGPPRELFEVFKKGEAAVSGPYKDEWGYWISAFIPIMDPETRKVYSVLGCDIEKAKWDQMLYLSRLQPIIITLLICIILIIAFLLHQSSLEASLIISESENKYRSLFNSSSETILILSVEGRFLEVNRIASDKTGYSHDELLKLSMGDLDSAEFEEFVPDRIMQIKNEGHAVFESSFLTKDKLLIPVEINASLIEYLGRPAVICLARDISDRKKIEGILKDSELKYRLLFNEMLTGFALHEIICDDNGNPCDYRFLEVNPAYERLTGLRASKIIGKTVLEILPDTEAHWIRDYGNVAITGKPITVESYHRALGKWYDVKAFSHEKGKFAVVFNDVTERKFSEEILKLEMDIVTAMSEVSSIRDAGRKVMEIMCRIDEVDSGGVYNLNPFTGELDMVANYGLSPEFVEKVSHYGTETYQTRVVKEGKVLFDSFRQIAMHADRTMEDEGLKAIALIPLICDGRPIAAINLSSHRHQEFSDIARKKILAVVGKISPVFLRVRISEALNEANIFNREIISNAGEGIVFLDRDFRCLVWNHTMENLSGIKSSDVIGKNAFALFPSLVEQGVDTALKRAMAGEVTYSSDFKIYDKKNGKTIFTRSIYVPHRNIKDEIAGIICVISDVTERKIHEDKMRKLSIAMEQSPALMLITDTEGNIEYVNPKFEAVTGYSSEDVRGKNPRILKSGEMPAEFYREMWDTIKSGKEWRGQFHNRKKNGEYFWESATISPIYDEKGVVTHYIAIKEDITREKELQSQLIQSQKMESIGRLAGGIAHDFNNIMQVINGFTEFILMKMDKDDTNRPDLEEIGKAGKRASEITNQLLIFSRRRPSNKQELDINGLVMSLQRMFQLVIGNEVRIENILFPGISKIKADASQLEQVLMNLVVNARDAMPAGGVLKFITSNIYLDEDDVASITEAQPGRFVCISVSDSGEGMPPEVKEHLFEPFFTTKPNGKGTGLGLSIVYGIVKQHNGWINVFSESGRGTTFEIYLPAMDSDDRKGVSKQPRTDTKKIMLKGNGERILLVEDENSVRNLTTRILKDNNYIVFPAADAVEAIRMFNEEKGVFDLILSDVVLPGQNGVALVEELLRRNSSLKILMASGYSDERLGRQSIEEKGLRLLQKPYHYNQLLQSVREMLSEK
ncbi:MAG: PAS domain S-box protein [Victivallales bacterium]